MRKTVKALALAGACGLALCGAARADVIYTYDGLPTYTINPSFQSGGGPLGTTITLDITDAAVQSGSFQLSGTGGVPPAAGQPFRHDIPSYTGDVAGLVSFTASGLATATPTSFPPYNVFNISFTFDPSGYITSDTVQYFGPSDDGLVSGNGTLTTGAIGSDDPRCNSDYRSGVCTVSGSWTETIVAPVPEPATFALLGAGLIGLAAVRRGTFSRAA